MSRSSVGVDQIIAAIDGQSMPPGEAKYLGDTLGFSWICLGYLSSKPSDINDPLRRTSSIDRRRHLPGALRWEQEP
jgi:hypothetical protein